MDAAGFATAAVLRAVGIAGTPAGGLLMVALAAVGV